MFLFPPSRPDGVAALRMFAPARGVLPFAGTLDHRHGVGALCQDDRDSFTAREDTDAILDAVGAVAER